MSTLNISTRKIKPAIVVDQSPQSEETNTEKLERTYNILVHFNFEEIVNRQNVKVWQYQFLSYDEPIGYPQLVADLVRAKYSDEQALAIMLNNDNEFESEEKRQEHRLEYQALQQWRSRAKEIAKEAFEFAVTNNIPTVQ